MPDPVLRHTIQELRRRRARIDDAIALLEQLEGSNGMNGSTRPPARRRPVDGLAKTIAETLKEHGAMRPTDVATAVKTDLPATRAAFRELVAADRAVATGNTTTRKWQLKG